MEEKRYREYHIDGDVVRVAFYYDEETAMWFGEYPDFNESLRITPSGRRWVNAIGDGCPYADKEYGDCGSCSYYRPEREGDLIGVCDHEETRIRKIHGEEKTYPLTSGDRRNK